METNSTPAVSNWLVETQWVTNRFDWSQLESAQLDEFVAKLRAVGCPPRTIRDLVLARVERLQVAREREIKFADPFWLAGRERARATRTRELQLQAWDREMTATLRQLIGVEWSPEADHNQDLTEQAVFRFCIGPVTEDQFERVSTWVNSLATIRDTINSQTGGVWLEEDHARYRAEIQREVEGCRGWFSPAQFEEFVARTAAFGEFFEVDDLSLLPITPDELRRISLATAETCGWPRELLDVSIVDDDEEENTHELALQQRFRAILGDERWAEIERLQDHDYRAILELVIENGLPRERAQAAHEVRQLVNEEAARLQADQTLDPTGHRRQVDTLAVAAQASLLSLLGEAAYGQYLGGGGQWLTNLTMP